MGCFGLCFVWLFWGSMLVGFVFWWACIVCIGVYSVAHYVLVGLGWLIVYGSLRGGFCA